MVQLNIHECPTCIFINTKSHSVIRENGTDVITCFIITHMLTLLLIYR